MAPESKTICVMTVKYRVQLAVLLSVLYFFKNQIRVAIITGRNIDKPRYSKWGRYQKDSQVQVVLSARAKEKNVTNHICWTKLDASLYLLKDTRCLRPETAIGPRLSDVVKVKAGVLPMPPTKNKHGRTIGVRRLVQTTQHLYSYSCYMNVSLIWNQEYLLQLHVQPTFEQNRWWHKQST